MHTMRVKKRRGQKRERLRGEEEVLFPEVADPVESGAGGLELGMA